MLSPTLQPAQNVPPAPGNTNSVPGSGPDPEMQQLYQEAMQRGLFAKDPEMQQLGHEMRQRGLVADPTQGGAVQPAAPNSPIQANAPVPANDPADPLSSDPLSTAIGQVNDTLAAFNAAPNPQTAAAHKAALTQAMPLVAGSGLLQRPDWQKWAGTVKSEGWLDPDAPQTPASQPNQAVMSEAPKLNPLQEAEQAVKTGFSTYWNHLTTSLQGIHDELADPTDSSNQGLHVGQLGAGVMDMGKSAVQAVPDVAKSLYYHAIGHGDDYDVQQSDQRAMENVGSVVDAPLMAAEPFGLRQATDAMAAFTNGDKAGALKILKAAPGQIGEYAKENKLEAALMLLPALMHGAGMATEAVRRTDTLRPRAAAPSADTAPRPAQAPAPETAQTVAAEPTLARSVNGVPLGRQKPALGNPVQPLPARAINEPQAVPEPAQPPAPNNGGAAPQTTAQPVSQSLPAGVNQVGDLKQLFSGGGKGGFSAALYDDLWAKVQAGDTQELGQPSTLLQVALPLYRAGKLGSVDDLKALSDEVMGIKGRLTGPAYQQALSDAVNRRLSAPAASSKTAPAAASAPVDAGSPTAASAPAPTPPPTQDARFAENFPVDQLRLDPDRFQYKIGYGTGGSSGSLTDAKAFNPDFAGVIHAWRDPADGQAYVVNGHNRVGLAQRTGTPGMDVRFLDAEDAADARTKGALINIAEGQGTALDAAKLFKDTGYTQADVQAMGINLKGQKATQGMALANLNDALFVQAMRGEMPVERASIIGDTLPDHGDQATLLKQIGNASPTNDQVREMAQAIAQGPRQTSETSSLFGTQEVTRSLAVERAQAASYIKAQLAKESAAFGNASKNADRLEKGNNTIDAAQSATLAQQNRQASDIFDAVKNAPGEVSTLLNSAALRLAKAKDTGETPDAIKQDALQQFQDYAQRTYLPSRQPGASSPSTAGGSAPLDARPSGSLPDGAGGGEVRGRQPAEGQSAAEPGAVTPLQSTAATPQPAPADLVMKSPEAPKAAPAPPVPAYSKSMDFGAGEPRPFDSNPHLPEAVREMLRRGQDEGNGARSYSGKLLSDPESNAAAMQKLQQGLERSAASGNGSIFRTSEGGTIFRASEGSHDLHVGLHPDGRAAVRVQPAAEEDAGLFAGPKPDNTQPADTALAEADHAPEHGDAPPTPAADLVAASLSPEAVAAISKNLAKVASDPQAAPLAAQAQAGISAAQARGVPRIANSAGAFGGKAVSDILEHATDRIAAGISHVTSAAADSSVVRATRNGRYRGSYEVDKVAGDAVNQLAASGESAHTYAHYATKHVLADLDPQQRTLLVDHLLDERAQAIEAAGGTPNRADLRALTPQEVQQVQTDPKLQAALMKFESGPMGTIQRLRQFVSPRMSLQQTGSGRFLSLLAKEDASGNAVNESAGSGRPTSGMSGKGTVKGTRHAQQATGTAQAYSHDLGEIMQHDLTEVNQKANLKQVYKTLLAQRDAQGNRLAYSSALRAKAPLPDTITYNGKEYPAVDVKPGYRYVDKSGKIQEISIRVPAPIASDLEDALTAPKRGNDIGAVAQQVSGLATSLSLMSPAEITNHMGRLVSIASKLPAVGTALPQRLSEIAAPYAGPRAGALYRIASTDMSDPKNVAVLQRIMDANGGSGRPFARDIGNSLASKVPGLAKVQHFTHDFLFSLPEGKGLAGFDLRLRVMAEKMRAEAEGNTDPKRVREFANQFGQYTSKPEKLIQSLRTIAPFSATSLPLKMTEMRMMLGDAGLKNLSPAQSATLRAETLFRGTAGTILAFSLMNHALSGHWPWQNAPGHATDLEVGKDKGGKPVYVGGNRIDPTLERPLSTLGVPDMISDLRPSPVAGKQAAGRSPAINALIKDLARGGYNAAGSSLSSPMTQAVTTATVGHDPLYLTRSGQMLPTSAAATKKNGQSQALDNLRAAVGGTNPALGAALGTDKQSREAQYQAPLWRTVQQLERLTGPILKTDTKKTDTKKQQSRPPSAAMKALRQQVEYR